MPLVSSSRVQVAVIEVEALLGLWLLTGLYPVAAHWAAFATFSLFACASLYLTWIGESSCTCFGRLSTKPWVSLVVDVAAVVGISLFALPAHYRSANLSPTGRLGGNALVTASAAAAILLLLVGGGLFIYGNGQSALATLRGEYIAVQPGITDIGVGTAGEEREFTVQLVNYLDHPVRIIGGSATCSCVATDDLPLTVLPHLSRPIRVRITLRGVPGFFQERFVLYSDDAMQEVLVARISGQITDRHD